jgi:hypothetical protein
MKHSSKFSKNLAQYLASAGALLAVIPAQSQIVYVDVNPDIVVGDGGVDEYLLDLNNDGDFEFRLFGEGETLGIYKYYAYNNDKVLAYPNGLNQFMLKQLNYGDVISTNIVDWDAVGYAAWQGYNFWSGVEKYVGIRFKQDNKFRFGWMRLQVTIDSPNQFTMTLKDYAYNNIADEPIPAGADGTTSCDMYEPNNNFSKARSINPNSTVFSLIDPAGDKDFFKFTTTNSKSYVRVILSDLPKNYDVALFNEQKEKIDVSKNTQKSNDTVIYNTPSEGTYYVKVYQKNDNYDPGNCYSLTIETSTDPFRISSDFSADKRVSLNIYPKSCFSNAYDPLYGRIKR